jgi:hypothetical protein
LTDGTWWDVIDGKRTVKDLQASFRGIITALSGIFLERIRKQQKTI